MIVECHHRGSYVVARVLVDNLDRESARELVQELDPWIRTGANLVLDLSGVNVADFAALGFIAIGARRIRVNEGSCRLCGLNGRMRDAVNLVNLGRLIDGIYTTVDEAVSSSRETDVLANEV